MKSILDLLQTKAVTLDLYSLGSNLVLAILIGLLLRWFYVRFSTSRTNRRALADNFVLLIASMTLIIFLIKSSIALSLGLVGALSIVRFRAAIKEPEELVYLFFAIGMGLGLGADQRAPTLIALAIVLPSLYLKNRFQGRHVSHESMFLNIKRPLNGSEDVLQEFSEIFATANVVAELRRFDQLPDRAVATFVVTPPTLGHLQSVRERLQSLDPRTEITIVDNSKPMVLS